MKRQLIRHRGNIRKRTIKTLQTTVKDFHKKMNSQIDSLKFPSLDKYLDTKYAYVKERNFTCDICNAFTGTNKQSLSAHKRGCRKKNLNNSINLVSDFILDQATSDTSN